MHQPFDGAKLALLSGGRILTMLRDDKPDIPFPDMWDLPGGGRDPGESPQDCVLRETWEEFGLRIAPELLTYRKAHKGTLQGQGDVWFFAVVLANFDPGLVRFGDEGQRWEMMDIDTFLNHPRAVRHLQQHLREFLCYDDIATRPA